MLVYVIYQIIKLVILDQSWRKSENDLNIISDFSEYFVLVSMLGLNYVKLFLIMIVCMLRRLYVKYGMIRLCFYVIFVCLFSYVFTALLLDGIVTGTWNVFKSEVVQRFEDNIISLSPSRKLHKHTIVHPQTHGEHRPVWLEEKYLYRGEDAYFTSKCELTGTLGPQEDIKVVWMKNRKPLPSSARFRQDLNITESTKNDTLTNSTEKRDLSLVTITATLRIYMVKSKDYGNYTCHVLNKVQLTYRHNITLKVKSTDLYVSVLDLGKGTEELLKKISSFTAEKTHLEDKFEMAKNMYASSPFEEFRLTETSRKQIIVTVPPGAIIHFQPDYFHLSESGSDIFTEYFINGEPAELMGCEGQFSGCSKLLLLYLYFGYKNYVLPPTVENLDFEWNLKRQKRPWYFHCLCASTYGRHNVHFLRQVYNARTDKYQLMEVYHPDELVVLPREQDMLNFHKATSHDSQRRTPSPQDMHYVKLAAASIENEFAWKENLLIVAGIVLFAIILSFSCLLVKWAGNYAGRRIFNEFIPNLRRRDIYRREVPEDADTQFSRQHFDFFISHSEEDMELVKAQILPVLKERGQTVCTSELGIPPNLQLISAVSTAIENSDRYIIILSLKYLNDRFKQHLEAGMIGDNAISSKMLPRSSLLIIKVDDCPLLPWMTSFEVHDWATSLPRKDHLLRLSRWVKKPNPIPELVLFLIACFFIIKNTW